MFIQMIEVLMISVLVPWELATITRAYVFDTNLQVEDTSFEEVLQNKFLS